MIEDTDLPISYEMKKYKPQDISAEQIREHAAGQMKHFAGRNPASEHVRIQAIKMIESMSNEAIAIYLMDGVVKTIHEMYKMKQK